jgi:hypothetical protein
VFAADANWVELTRRLVEVDIIPDTEAGRAILQRILSVAPQQK